jgi:hypothetical protein
MAQAGLNQFQFEKLTAGQSFQMPDGFSYGYIENDSLAGDECVWRMYYPENPDRYIDSGIGFTFPSTTPVGHKGPVVKCITGSIKIIYQG